MVVLFCRIGGGSVLQRGAWSWCVVPVLGGCGVMHLFASVALYLWWVVVVYDCVGCLFSVVAVLGECVVWQLWWVAVVCWRCGGWM